MNREPSKPVRITGTSMAQFLKQLPSFLRAHRDFSRYLLSQSLVILGSMGTTFCIVYARRLFDFSDAFAADLTVVALISQALGTPLLGWFSDRAGHKRQTQLSTCLGVVGLVILLVLPGQGWLHVVYVFMNLSLAGLMIARMGITMEFGRIEKLPTFTALAGTVLGAPTLLAPVIGGWLIDMAGYRAMFLAAMVFCLTGFLVLQRGVQDPRVSQR